MDFLVTNTMKQQQNKTKLDLVCLHPHFHHPSPQARNKQFPTFHEDMLNGGQFSHPILFY